MVYLSILSSRQVTSFFVVFNMDRISIKGIDDLIILVSFRINIVWEKLDLSYDKFKNCH